MFSPRTRSVLAQGLMVAAVSGFNPGPGPALATGQKTIPGLATYLRHLPQGVQGFVEEVDYRTKAQDTGIIILSPDNPYKTKPTATGSQEASKKEELLEVKFKVTKSTTFETVTWQKNKWEHQPATFADLRGGIFVVIVVKPGITHTATTVLIVEGLSNKDAKKPAKK